jgi:hypothetical protein
MQQKARCIYDYLVSVQQEIVVTNKPERKNKNNNNSDMDFNE